MLDRTIRIAAAAALFLLSLAVPSLAGAQQWQQVPQQQPQQGYAPPPDGTQYPMQPPPEQAAPPAPDRGDMRDWPAMAHVIFKLGHYTPFGGLEDRLSLSDASSNETLFFLGGGARVGNVVVDLIFGIGGSGLRGDLQRGIEELGYEAHGWLNFVFGLEGVYYFMRGSQKSFWPFAGLGLSYEALLTGGDSGGANYSRSYGGWQLRPMVGVDFPLASAFALGIALEMGVGGYGDITESAYMDDDITTPENETVTTEVENDLPNSPGLHGWIGLAARIVLLP